MQFLTNAFTKLSASAYALLAIDPLKIATNAESGDRITVTGEKDKGFLGLFAFNDLYHILKREVFIWGTIVTVFILVTMLFATKSEKLAEKKSDVMHKLLIILLASSTLTLLSVFVNLLDAVF